MLLSEPWGGGHANTPIRTYPISVPFLQRSMVKRWLNQLGYSLSDETILQSFSRITSQRLTINAPNQHVDPTVLRNFRSIQKEPRGVSLTNFNIKNEAYAA
ncbi:UNVERIFIED_CONTAM: hypothetical protein K2H54_033401 [Gekko kuhli]